MSQDIEARYGEDISTALLIICGHGPLDPSDVETVKRVRKTLTRLAEKVERTAVREFTQEEDLPSSADQNSS